MYLKQKCTCGAEFEVENDDTYADGKGLASLKMQEWEEKHESICAGITSKPRLPTWNNIK